ncbi:MAG: hypothetical protein M3R41_05590, partial [Pseudomonadota bacterium]|nr:hypothetical protein [Pseudomonadota bacterium]
LVCGGIALAPAAQARKEEAKPTGPTLSPKFRTAAVAAQTALQGTDLAAADAALTQAEAAASTDDDKALAQTFRVALESKKAVSMPGGTSPGLVSALDAAMTNPKLPKETLARFTFARAQIAYNAKQYKDALPLLVRARDAGFVDASLPLYIAQAKVETGDVAGGTADMQTAIKGEEAAGRKAPEGWYKYMISHAFHANDMASTDAWTRAWLAAYPTKENWRSAIYTFGFEGQAAKRLTDRQRVDLYRLMRASNSLAGPREWMDYAVYVNRVGLPNEAVTVINDGRKANIITASDSEAGILLKTASSAVKADKSLAAQEASAKASSSGSLAAQAGDSYLGAQDYAKAAEMYRLALSKGVTDTDPVNLHLGIALALAGNKADAQTAFATMKGEPNIAIAKLWTVWLASPPAA